MVLALHTWNCSLRYCRNTLLINLAIDSIGKETHNSQSYNLYSSV